MLSGLWCWIRRYHRIKQFDIFSFRCYDCGKPLDYKVSIEE